MQLNLRSAMNLYGNFLTATILSSEKTVNCSLEVKDKEFQLQGHFLRMQMLFFWMRPHHFWMLKMNPKSKRHYLNL